MKNDKTEIEAKIEELTESTIKYKKFEMLDVPSYNINKRDVFMIIYKNGTKEYMEVKEKHETISGSSSLGNANITIKIDKVKGEIISHEKFIFNGNKVFFEGKALNRKKQIKVMGEKGSTQLKDILSS